MCTEPDSSSDFGYRIPTLDTIRQLYTVLAPYSDLIAAPKYILERNITGRLAEMIRVVKPRSVLETGCGTGTTLTALAQLFPSVQFAGLDLTEAMLERARRRARNCGLKNLQLEVGSHTDAHRIFKGQTFGLGFAKCALCLWPMPLVDFDQAANSQLAREAFIDGDPTCCFLRSCMSVLHPLLIPGAPFVDIGMSDGHQRSISIEAMEAGGFRHDPERSVCVQRFKAPREPFSNNLMALSVLSHEELRSLIEQYSLEDIISPNTTSLNRTEAEELTDTLRRDWSARQRFLTAMERDGRTVDMLSFQRI